MSWKIVHEPKTEHYCKMPYEGLDFTLGTIIECTVCSTQWEAKEYKLLFGRYQTSWQQVVTPEMFDPNPVDDEKG